MRTHSSHTEFRPDILRSPELHDLSDLPRFPAAGNRMLMVALAVAALLTAGHVVHSGATVADTPHHIVSRV